jgi:hypothetical protein
LVRQSDRRAGGGRRGRSRIGAQIKEVCPRISERVGREVSRSHRHGHERSAIVEERAGIPKPAIAGFIWNGFLLDSECSRNGKFNYAFAAWKARMNHCSLASFFVRPKSKGMSGNDALFASGIQHLPPAEGHFHLLQNKYCGIEKIFLQKCVRCVDTAMSRSLSK